MKNNDCRIIEKDSFDKVRNCIVKSRTGSTYYLNCKLYKHGRKDVVYKRGENFLMWHERFRYTLSKFAVEDLESELIKFDNRINKIIDDNSYFKIEFVDIGLVLYYRRNSNGTFDWMIENIICDKSSERYGQKEYTFVDGLEIGSHFQYDVTKYSFDASTKLYNSDYDLKPENLHNHPLYISAARNNDEWLINELEAKFGINNEKAIEYMEKKDGIKRLPFLTKEYDKTYTISQDNIDYGLLCASGYELLHRPYFAMIGSSHNLCELNPYLKKYVDAGRTDVKTISFKDYLNLFEENNIKM